MGTALGEDDIWRERDQFGCVLAGQCCIAVGPADIDPHVAAVGPAQLCQTLPKCRHAVLHVYTIGAAQHADASHALALLRARRVRPGRRHPANTT